MQISLKNKRVFITAGATGIGLVICLTMQKLGAQVFTCDIDQNALKKLPKQIQGFSCDVANSKQLDVIFKQILPVDILVNNAGSAGPRRLKILAMSNGNNVLRCV